MKGVTRYSSKLILSLCLNHKMKKYCPLFLQAGMDERFMQNKGNKLLPTKCSYILKIYKQSTSCLSMWVM